MASAHRQVSIQVRNRLRHSEVVAGAAVRITRQGLQQPLMGTTNQVGLVTIATTGAAP